MLPRLTILFEGGVIGPHVEVGKMPPSTNEQRAARRANMLLSITDILLLQQRGYVDYGFLGGAQIDHVRKPEQLLHRRSRETEGQAPGNGRSE